MVYCRLECQIDAYTPPMVNWYVNGVEIKPSPHYDISYADGKTMLLIIEVGPEDTGEYTVKAKSDEIGEVVSSTTLYVQGRDNTQPLTWMDKCLDTAKK